jgi:hypothetical protein
VHERSWLQSDEKESMQRLFFPVTATVLNSRDIGPRAYAQKNMPRGVRATRLSPTFKTVRVLAARATARIAARTSRFFARDFANLQDTFATTRHHDA